MQSFSVRELERHEAFSMSAHINPFTPAGEIAVQALRAKDATIIGAFDGGYLAAVASYRTCEGPTKLISIASFRKGGGTALVNKIRESGPMWCKGVSTAAGFYEKMGMKRGEKIMVGDKEAYIYADNNP